MFPIIRQAVRSCAKLPRFLPSSISHSSRFATGRSKLLHLGSSFSHGINTMRCFSSTVSRYSAGSGDQDLAHKLLSELKYEQEAVSENPNTEFIDTFVAQSHFQIIEKLGGSEVALTKSFGNEKIDVIFSIDDIANVDPYAFDDMGESQEEEAPTAFPVKCQINIQKKRGSTSSGVLSVEATAVDGEWNISSIAYLEDSALSEDTPEAKWKREGLYRGPEFANLDEELQELFYKYLEERGVDTSMACFVADFLEHKEANEYLQWLKDAQRFVSA